MKFKVLMTIQNPKNKTEVIEYLRFAEFYCNENDYGNGYHLWFGNKDKDDFYEVYLDIRYNTDFDKNYPEEWLASWIYRNWSGEQGSYDVIKLTIEKMED